MIKLLVPTGIQTQTIWLEARHAVVDTTETKAVVVGVEPTINRLTAERITIMLHHINFKPPVGFEPTT